MTEEVLMQTTPFKNTDPDLQKIADKVYAGKRLSREDGLLLFEKADLSFVGTLANHVREKLHSTKYPHHVPWERKIIPARKVYAICRKAFQHSSIYPQ